MPERRPFRAVTIDLLAAEFVAARDASDELRLADLRDELDHRGSRRARALAAHVRMALAKVAA